MKNRVEAILFTLGRFISVEEIARILNADKTQIQEALTQLDKEYSSRNSALSLQRQENKYKLNIRKEYGHLTNKLLANKEFDSPTTKTLAVIAYKNPAVQSEIIKVRGNKAYEHIKSLTESNLVTSEKQGRTRLLKLTQHFYDYFDVSENDFKQKFEAVKKESTKQENINLKKPEDINKQQEVQKP